MTSPFPPVTREAFYRTARGALGRVACAYADPAGSQHPHDHARECLTDEYATSADLLLRLAACIATGEEGAMLDMLTHITETVKRDKK